MRHLFKTSFLLVLLLLGSCKDDDQKYTEQKADYSNLFDYNVTLYVNNMTDDVITVQLVYLGSYHQEKISPNDGFFKTKVNALELLKYFNVDMSDSYLQNGEIRYILLSGKKILKYGWINRKNNFADNIIRKKNGEYEITGSSQTHLD